MSGTPGDAGRIVVDADGHILEPGSMWVDYIDPQYRDRAPRVVTQPDGSQAWVGEGGMPLRGEATAIAGLAGVARWHDLSRPENRLTLKYTDAHPGAFDPLERLRVLDAEGIDAAVLYPTWGLYLVKDPPYAAALHQAYNTWLADYCGAAPDRLFGVGAVPLQDIELAVAEMRRCVRDLGFTAIFIRPNPYMHGRRFPDSCYDRFWAEAQDLDCVIGLHPVRSDTAMPGATVAYGLMAPRPEGTSGGGGFIQPAMWLSHTLDSMVALADFVAGGVLERFPRLRVAVLESSGGWLPSVLEKLEHHFEYLAWQRPHLKSRPSELFKRNCYISFDPDEAMLAPTAQVVGADRIVWASDFPHPDAFFPGAVTQLRENLSPLPREAQRQILGENAVRLYRLRRSEGSRRKG